ITKWFRRARVDAWVTNTPPPGPGRAVSIPRISSRRMASLIVASATPNRVRSSSLVPSRWPGLSSPPVISCSSSRAIASPSEMRELVRNESVVVVSDIHWPPIEMGCGGERTTARSGGRHPAGVHRLEDGVRGQARTGQLGTDPPAMEDEDAGADGGELVDVRRRQEHDRAGRCRA